MKTTKKKYRIRKYSIAWFVVNGYPYILFLAIIIICYMAADHAMTIEEQQHNETTVILEQSEPIEIEVQIPEEKEEEKEVEVIMDFDYFTETLKEAAINADLDYKLAIAISRLETGNWKDIEKHWNFGGLSNNNGVPYSYDTMEEGLNAYIKCLSWYRDNGMFTPEEMANTYCPPKSDQWRESINTIIKEVK